MTDLQLRWLRLWTDVVEDEKLLLLAPSDRWYYVALLALKRTGMLDVKEETAEVRDRKVALRLRIEAAERDELRRRLIEARLVDASWQPSGWDNRQFESDDSTSRVRKWRRKMKRSGNVSTTFRERYGNVRGTPQSRADTDPPLPPAQKRAYGIRLAQAHSAYETLLASGGESRDARVQAAIDAIGGWSRIRLRTVRDEKTVEREFCHAYASAVEAGEAA